MSEQTISTLTDDDLTRLAEQRSVVTEFLTASGLEKFKSAAGKLGLLRWILREEKFSPEQTYELQSMGIVLGDVFVQEMGFHWVMVEDDYGRDPALKFQGTSIIIFPLTMISKRIERGDAVDIFELYNKGAALVQKMIDEETAN